LSNGNKKRGESIAKALNVRRDQAAWARARVLYAH